MTTDEAIAISESLLEQWRRRGGATYDPYDGLQTRWVSSPERLGRVARLALVHLHKRSPVNLRPLFRIPPVRNAYGEGLFASARLLLWRLLDDPAHCRAAEEGLVWLEGARVREGWTYPFDVQTRTFFYPKTTPNMVSTAFAANAFLDAAEATGEIRWLEAASGAARMVARDLWIEQGGRAWFAYLPVEDKLIHNANLLGVRLCERAGRMAGDRGLVDKAAAALMTTLHFQREDGSFLYGEDPDVRWVDGHHTGFVIECLHDVRDAFDVAAPLERASRYYAARLFGPNGEPLPAPGRQFPRDAIAGAQGIQTFAKLGDLELAGRIASWMRAMRMRNGSFSYQHGRLHRKRVAYARWSDAPMALALSTLAAQRRTLEAAA